MKVTFQPRAFDALQYDGTVGNARDLMNFDGEAVRMDTSASQIFDTERNYIRKWDWVIFPGDGTSARVPPDAFAKNFTALDMPMMLDHETEEARELTKIKSLEPGRVMLAPHDIEFLPHKRVDPAPHARHKTPAGWFWATSSIDDGPVPLFGPYETQEEAATACVKGGEVAFFCLPEVTCDVFRSSDIFLAMERKNFEGIRPGHQVNWPSGINAEELELELAQVLYRHLNDHGVFAEFDAMEPEFGPDPALAAQVSPLSER